MRMLKLYKFCFSFLFFPILFDVLCAFQVHHAKVPQSQRHCKMIHAKSEALKVPVSCKTTWASCANGKRRMRWLVAWLVGWLVGWLVDKAIKH